MNGFVLKLRCHYWGVEKPKKTLGKLRLIFLLDKYNLLVEVQRSIMCHVF